MKEIAGFKSAVMAMRNPMNSWCKSDSAMCEKGRIGECKNCGFYDAEEDICYSYDNEPVFVLGDNDLKLMQNLTSAGVEHRTFARMIQVWVTIDAPLFWWKEMDRYTIGKTQVSCSTMHKIHAKQFEPNDFSVENIVGLEAHRAMEAVINALNRAREDYLNETDPVKKKEHWRTMIELLPSSYNQKRTVNMTYEVCMKIWKERHNHKLSEWHTLCDFIMNLPYLKQIMKVGD